MTQLTLHLIGNAHLDPVWLWDWREGLNEGIITSRTILDLMDEDPELTLIRGEAAVYRHIEAHDPQTFRRIQRRVAEGRWDVVGGTFVQPDTNLPATETFARHFTRAQRYFISRFGRPARVAWAADSFGHSAGLPEILAAAGMRGFAFTRPDGNQIPLAKPAFWWEGSGGSRILAYRPESGSYCGDRATVARSLDHQLEAARKNDVENIGFFYGLGNHGGGPTRRQITDIRRWAKAHPEVRVVFSGLHRLFDALYDEVRRKGNDWLPVHRGELNYCLRGCYSSVAKLKFVFRKTENLLQRAERTDAAIGAALRAPSADLGPAWDAVLFNSFHDILPGSSIERAYDDQLAWLGGAIHGAQRAEIGALNALAAQIDTRVTRPAGDHPSAVAALAWNPHPHPFKGHIELEANLDYRPISAYQNRGDAVPLRLLGPNGRPLPFQPVATEHAAWVSLPWRKRVVVPVELPAMGWNVLEFGWVEGAPKVATPSAPVKAPRAGVIDNGIYRVEARAGRRGIRIFRKGRAVCGGNGLSATVFDDPWGSWGGMGEEPDSFHFTRVREQWRITAVETLEQGPERATLWIRLAGRRSWMELTVSLYRQRDAVDVSARLLWNERAARLKLVMPVGDRAEFEVPGGRVHRKPCGEVPGGRWVRVSGRSGKFGFASDTLYSFECRNGELRATVARAGRYARDSQADAKAEPWQPAVDCGELKFRFLLNPGDERLPILARELEQPPQVVLAPPKKGPLPRAGSFLSIAPETLSLLALKRAEDGRDFILRLQNTASRAIKPRLRWLGCKLALNPIPSGRIACWRLRPGKGGWKAKATDLLE